MILSPQQCLKRASEYVKSYNEINEEKAEEIRIGRKTMLMRLVQNFRKTLIDYTNGMSDVPTIYSNRKELGRLLGCSEKTVYNQLSFLETIGVVSKHLHGRQNDFELCLHPHFFFDFVEKPVLVSFKAVREGKQEPVSPSHFWQNLPPISSIESKEKNNNYYKKGVETVEKSKNESITTPPQFQGHEDFERKDERTRAKQSTFSTLPNERNKRMGAGGRESLPMKFSTLLSTTGLQAVWEVAQETRVKQSTEAQDLGVRNPETGLGDLPNDTRVKQSSTGEQDSSVRNSETGSGELSEAVKKAATLAENERYAWSLVEKLMMHGMEKLWPQTYFSEAHKAKIRMQIMDNVFDNCRLIANNQSKILQVYLNGINIIDKAYNYGVKKNYTSFMPALCYFDKKQSKGFFGAQKWIQNDQKRLDDAKREIYYQKAVYAVTHITHPRNRKDLMGNRLGIATYYQHLIGKRCGAELLTRFNIFLSNPKSFM